MKLFNWLSLALALTLAPLTSANAQAVKLGAGTYFLTPKGGDNKMPAARMRTGAASQAAAQTNQWYSSLIFNDKPEALFVQPLSVKAVAQGWELALPQKEIVPTERRDVEVHYPHKNHLLIAPAAFEVGPAQLAQTGDWSVEVSMARGSDDLRATLTRGSPFVFFKLSRGDVKIKLPEPAENLAPQSNPQVLHLKIKGIDYAVFGPSGTRWTANSPTEWTGHLPAGKTFVSAAALPNADAATLALFQRHAYAFITDTRVDWRYDRASSQVTTSFKATSQTMDGPDHGPLLGLYPHQWFNNPLVATQLGPAFDSIRGKIHLIAASEFQKTNNYTGFVPYWPGVPASSQQAELMDLLKSEKRTARRMMLQQGAGPYWQGKGLLRTLKLMDVAEQQGDLEGRDQLLEMVKKRMEEWLSGESSKTYFHYDASLGAVGAYPEEFFTATQINDHHFTYGYWIRAAAEIALRDKAWAQKSQWGGMIELLIADIATAERGRSDFPFLRTFDPYEGHSWASGIGLGASGNNQESSSEAINAWAALILWGEVTGNTRLRDLGIYLYTAEIEAIQYYWFDIHRQVFPPEYKNVETSMLFGGKYAHNTWWTDEPRQIKGINLLPITTASMYLGADPAYVQRNLAALVPEMALYDQFGKRPSNAPPRDIWQDIFAQYAALADPVKALSQWDRWGSVEIGESRSHALHFMLSLQHMGTPDLTVRANTSLYAVFKKANGSKTYLAYNAGSTPMQVQFSDGTTLTVAPASLGRTP